uniref:Uncharacterized protein n=1 Tax=Oryza nivara TaxID=4536 RepID=A0A0E0HFX5_ORYNI
FSAPPPLSTARTQLLASPVSTPPRHPLPLAHRRKAHGQGISLTDSSRRRDCILSIAVAWCRRPSLSIHRHRLPFSERVQILPIDPISVGIRSKV